ncbi:MAG: PAS domain S-box protein [Candidatus Roizmanbacteria bacterium]
MKQYFQNKPRNVFFTLALLLMIFGSNFVIRTWRNSVKSIENDALKIAQIAQAGLSLDNINKLDLNYSDLEKKEYNQIKKSLINIKNVDSNIRFTYIYIKRNDKLYFVADSEIQTSKDYSPPGQEYTEASREYFKPLKDGLPHISEPVIDRWGTWISILIPIKDVNSHEVIAVFGMDYPAEHWNDEAILHVIQTCFMVLAIYLLLCVIYIIIDNYTKSKENEKNYRNFFESIDDIIIVGDKQGKIYYTNGATSRKLGYSQKELYTMQVLDLNPKDKQREAKQIFDEMFAGNRYSCPLPLERKDGTLLPSETRIWFGKWDGKECIFGIVKDIGEDQELLQKFSKIFENNPSLMAISSLPDRAFIDANKSFLTKLGYTKEEVIGKTSQELNLFVNIEEQKKIAEILKNIGYIHDVDLQVKTKSGEILDGLFFGEIIETQGKQYFLTVMVDQTDNKQVKEEMAKKNKQLETINKVMVNRELKMVELKKEIDRLKNLHPV